MNEGTKGNNNVENLIFKYILYGDESIKKNSWKNKYMKNYGDDRGKNE
ncbi:hypothetical protein GCM10028868_38560 [Virgibacillus kimchii]